MKICLGVLFFMEAISGVILSTLSYISADCEHRSYNFINFGGYLLFMKLERAS